MCQNSFVRAIGAEHWYLALSIAKGIRLDLVGYSSAMLCPWAMSLPLGALHGHSTPLRLQEMPHRSLRADAISYNSVISSYDRLRLWKEALHVHLGAEKPCRAPIFEARDRAGER